MSILEGIINLVGYSFNGKRKLINRIFDDNEITKSDYENLILGLDEDSKSLIDALVYMNTEEFKKQRIVNKKKMHIYSKFYKLTTMEKLYYNKIMNLPNKKLLTEVFKYHCGLKFISKGNKEALKDKVAITAGASWGDSALIFSKIYGSKVYAFEPNINSYQELQKTIINNNLQGSVISVKKGISDKNAILSFEYNGSELGTKFIESQDISQSKQVEQIEVASIDSFAKDNEIVNLGIIHLDIEGFEYRAIQGAKNIIIRDKPILLISIYHNATDFFKIKPLIESWSLGYTFKIRKLERIKNEIMLICEVEN